jgi:hypothetical protein
VANGANGFEVFGPAGGAWLSLASGGPVASREWIKRAGDFGPRGVSTPDKSVAERNAETGVRGIVARTLGGGP